MLKIEQLKSLWEYFKNNIVAVELKISINY